MLGSLNTPVNRLNGSRGAGLGQTAGVATVMFVHAHPDDEALLTGGTMAKLHALGHRVVLVTATDGAAGLASPEITDLANVRGEELANSCKALGVDSWHGLGYSDSGLDGKAEIPDGDQRFVDVEPSVAAKQLAELVEQEGADIVVGYDQSGGYGHPDHIQVHKVVRALVADHPVVGLEATAPREPLLRLVKTIYACRYVVPPLGGLDIQTWQTAFTPRAELAYRVDVRDFLAAKRSALAAHASQATGDSGPRTLSALLKLPRWLFKKVMGHEFYRTIPGNPDPSGVAAATFGAAPPNG